MRDNRIPGHDNRIYYSLTAPETQRVPRITRIIMPQSRLKRIVKRMFRRK